MKKQDVSEDKILETEWDFVPLDKIIPLKTAVNIFNREHRKNKDGDYFKRGLQRF